jgi:hypothetical protein
VGRVAVGACQEVELATRGPTTLEGRIERLGSLMCMFYSQILEFMQHIMTNFPLCARFCLRPSVVLAPILTPNVGVSVM